MSDRHPYWSYGPDHGVPLVDAMAEGRRTFALELAASTLLDSGDGERLVRRARELEAYLLGDEGGGIMIGKRHLEALEDAARRLSALERVPTPDGPVRVNANEDYNVRSTDSLQDIARFEGEGGAAR